MRLRHIIGATVIAGLAACSDSVIGPHQGSRDFEWEGSVAAGSTVEVRGVNGSIHVRSRPGRDVDVFAEIRSTGDDIDEVMVEVVSHDGGITVCARYPLESGGLAPCTPDGFDNDRLRATNVVVEFTVTIPEDVVFDGLTINGSIVAPNLVGDGYALTVNGDIEIETQGIAEAATINGSVTASIGQPSWSGGLHFNSINGSVRVEIPTGTDAWVEGGTVNGSVSTDFALTVQRVGTAERFEGILGQGGGSLLLGTINGNVSLRRGD